MIEGRRAESKANKKANPKALAFRVFKTAPG